VSLPFCRDDLEATLAPFDEARPLPPCAAWDPDVFAFDRDELFGRAWRMVGHESELQAGGSYLVAPLTPEGILVTRAEDGALYAFYNVCRHRGATLVDAPCGRAEALACPYHRWVYGLDGRLRSAPGAASQKLGQSLRPVPVPVPVPVPGSGRGNGSQGPPGFLTGPAGDLVAVRVATFGGFVFVQLDPDAPDLDEALGDVPPWLASLPPLRLAGRRRYEVLANWKLCVENFQESHHFPLVHPSLEALTPTDRARSVLGDGPWLGGVMDLVDGRETVSASGTRMDRPWIVPEERRRVFDAHLFPSLLTSLQPDYFLTYRLHPLAPDRTLIIADTWVDPGCPEASIPDVLSFWERVNAEDRAICERQQLGVRSRGFAPVGYARVEDGVHAFDRLVAGRYLDALDDDEPDSAPPPPPPKSKLVGIWGRPYLDLSGDVDISCFAEIDEEIAYGLARVEVGRTGGSLKHMGVVAPWVHEDPYVDYGHVIEGLSREELERFVSLAHDPSIFDPARLHDYRFGDETDHPLSAAQIRYLVYRHDVYFPWNVCYHLLEDERWEDKHSGAGKDFAPEAQALFPRTVAFVKSLPFIEIGRAVIFGLEADHHAPLHRDSEPGKDLTIAQSISFSPRGNKRLYLTDADGGSRTIVRAPIYWFNDMDYHGVLPDPFFRYSIRVDGVFEPGWARRLARKHGR
jgi:glycine betaine catabolism A